MLVRNGILTCFRQKGRTILFFLLLTVLAMALLLAQGVMLYCDSALTQADSQYRSIAVVEYMGEDYPSRDAADPAARKALESFEALDPEALPGVKAFTKGTVLSAEAEGYRRNGGKIPYLNHAVLVLSRFTELIKDQSEIPFRTAIINQSLYSRKDYTNNIIDILLEDADFRPGKGEEYVLCGYFVTKTTPEMPANGLQVFVVENVLPSDEPAYARVTDKTVPERFRGYAEYLELANNYVRVIPCADVEDQRAFHQNEIHLESGEFPGEGECVITPDLAAQLDLAPGDELSLRMAAQSEEDAYVLFGTDETKRLRVGGISSASIDYYGTVWTVGENAETPLFGYQLGTLSLENAKAEDTVIALRGKAPAGVRVTLFDQGYGETVKPFRQVRSSAQNIFLLSLAGVLVVLFFFAFLYIGRQRDTIHTMVSLGTTNGKIALWMLSGAFVLILLSVGLGTMLGRLLQPFIMEKVTAAAGLNEVEHLSLQYSETDVGVVREAVFSPKIPLWPCILAAAGILVSALLLCLLFLALTRRGTTRKRGKNRVRVPHGRTSAHGSGPFRFARLSILRGGLRTMVVPLVTAVLTVLIIFLSGVYQGWVNELADLEKNTQIDGVVLSLDGRSYAGLSTSLVYVRKLQEIEGVENVSVSKGSRYWLEEEMPDFGAGFGRENRDLWIFNQPDLTAVRELRAAKDFYYQEASVEWLEGWDEQKFGETETPALMELFDASGIVSLPEEIERLMNYEYPAVPSREFLTAHGLDLGDSLFVNVQIEYGSGRHTVMRERGVLLRIVGAYRQQGSEAHIYVPLSAYCPKDILEGEEAPPGEAYHRKYLRDSATFETCRFTLESASRLQELRAALSEQGFSEVGRIHKIRTTVLLSDASYLKLKESMERNISIGRTVGILIAVLVVVIGFLISWLMTSSRKQEFALMRGFGAGRMRIFLSFFHEQ
ncbi:MAG: hypothetical protein J6Y95_04530, partial [Lachnospiraceae bacterium]|nr:hypothetical protein [Lachnospiraceae bacterium]